MFTKFVKGQLIAAAVIAVIALAVVGLQYVKLPRLLGFGQMSVAANFTDATGIYATAIVALRGVEVGKVTAVDVTPTGARVHMSIDDDVSVPRAVIASIRSTSAIGENYVELTPKSAQPPFLSDGDSIPTSDTRSQLPVSKALTNLTDLANSVPAESTTSVLNESVAAFGGSGRDLHDIISGFDRLATASDPSASAELVAQLNPFLRTQLAIDPDLQTLSRDLRSTTKELAGSDHDLRSLITHTPPAAEELLDLEHKVSGSLPMLLDNFTSTGQVLRLQVPGLTQIMSIYPAVVAALQTAITDAPTDWTVNPSPPGKVLNLRVRLTANDPPPCYEGFIPMSQQRAFEDLSPAPLQQDMYCKAPQDDVRAVRGVRNTPCANDPGKRTAYFEECVGRPRGSQPVPAGSIPVPQFSARSYPTPPPSGSSDAEPRSPSNAAPAPAASNDFATTYDPRSGLAFGPDGQLYQVGGVNNNAQSERTWQRLLLK